LRKGQISLAHQQERLTEAYLHGVIPLAEYERRRMTQRATDFVLVTRRV
jgi:hypothetical protein